MKLNENERDTVVAALFVIFGLYMTYVSLQIRIRDTFIESAAVFPFVISCLVTLLSVIYLVKSLKKGGKPALSKIMASLLYFPKNPENRQVLISVLLVALLVFLGVPYLGYYPSSFIFMSGILIIYVRSIKPLLSLGIGAAFTGLLYLVFVNIFGLPVR